MGSEKLVQIAGTERKVWPGSRHADLVDAEDEVLLTAWLRPRRGGDLDADGAATLGATPPLRRTYTDRKALARKTDVDPADVELLRRYCNRSGIDVVDSHWRSVALRGSLADLIRAFGATVAIFEDETGRRFRHRSGALHLPADITTLVRGIFGLHQWPRSRKIGSLQRHASPLRARDVAARYRFPDGDGGGQTIGVVAFRGTFNVDDFDRSMSAQGTPASHPIVKNVDGAVVTHKVATTKDLEAALDVQIIGSLAPGARIVVYEAPDDERGFLDAIRTALFDEEFAPSVLSVSYGWPEQLWTPAALTIVDELFTVAALTGVSVFCSSGDNGAELDGNGKPHVLAPASSPFAVACGATVIGDAGETAWESSGGGFSEHFALPAWQQVARPAASRYGMQPARAVPDVAAQQSPGYYVMMDGVELAMGGTSAVAPVWSALTARINQRLGSPVGFFSPILYERASQSLFGDVTAGNNGFFAAAAGWNPCTGLGIPNGTAIENALRGSG